MLYILCLSTTSLDRLPIIPKRSLYPLLYALRLSTKPTKGWIRCASLLRLVYFPRCGITDVNCL